MGCGDREVYLDFEMHRVLCETCGVKNEKLDFLSDNTRYTLRFAMQIGGLCRAMTITDVARLMHLDWHTVMCGWLPLRKRFFDRDADTAWCGHVSGMFVRSRDRLP